MWEPQNSCVAPFYNRADRNGYFSLDAIHCNIISFLQFIVALNRKLTQFGTLFLLQRTASKNSVTISKLRKSTVRKVCLYLFRFLFNLLLSLVKFVNSLSFFFSRFTALYSTCKDPHLFVWHPYFIKEGKILFLNYFSRRKKKVFHWVKQESLEN